MAKELLDRIIDEIRQRKAESREAYEETQRLQAALAALGQPESRRPASRPMWPSCSKRSLGSLATASSNERHCLVGVSASDLLRRITQKLRTFRTRLYRISRP
jgi:hypothetical protein